MDIPKEYIITKGLISKTELIDFPRYFFDTLLADDKLSKYILAAKLPGVKEYKNAERSSRIGTVVGLFSPITWEKIPVGIMLFDDCPLNYLRIRQGDIWAHMFSTTPELVSRKFGNVIIKPKTKGHFGSKEVVGVEIKGKEKKTPGLSEVKNDGYLIQKMILLFKSEMLFYKDIMDDQKFNEIRFIITKNPFRLIGGSDEQFGRIELGFDTRIKEINKMHNRKHIDYAVLCKTAFEVVNELLTYLKPMWSC